MAYQPGEWLINNTVLRVFADNSDNLWVTLDNGIAQIHVNSPIYFYEPLEAQIGMVHDMVIEKGIVYLATNQGLYALSENDSYPTLIPGTQEQNMVYLRCRKSTDCRT